MVKKSEMFSFFKNTLLFLTLFLIITYYKYLVNILSILPKRVFSDIVSSVMPSQDNLVKLVHKDTGEIYWSTKNRKKLAGIKLELKKYSKKLRKVVTFKESKK